MIAQVTVPAGMSNPSAVHRRSRSTKRPKRQFSSQQEMGRSNFQSQGKRGCYYKEKYAIYSV